MNDVIINRPECRPVRRRVRRIIAGILLTGIVGCGACAIWFYVLGPQPPEVALPEDDPGAALDIAAARSDVKKWPFRSSKWGRLGRVLTSYGFHHEAVICYSRAARLRPSNPNWHLQLGRVYAKLREYDAAEKAFREALRLNPDSFETLEGLSIVLEQQGEFSDAAEQCRKALKLKPDAVTIHFRLALCLESEGDRAAAIESLQNALRYKPDAPIVCRELARLLADAGRDDEARRALQRALELSPGDRKLQMLRDRLEDEAPETSETPAVE